MIDTMTVNVITDPAQISSLLDRLLAADPVRATVLGSIVAEVRAETAPDAWCAVRQGTDAVAIRSDRRFPALFTSGWDGPDLAAAIALVRQLPDLIGVSGPVDTVDPAVAAMPDRQQLQRTGIRLFRLDELASPQDVTGEPRPASADDRELLVDWYGAFNREAHAMLRRPAEFVDRALATGRAWLWWDGGRPVSLAARRPPEAGSARIGPVYTPADCRGQGYASAVTAAATRDILDLGAIPVLFTDLANPTSNKIYQLLGYYPVEDRVQITFAP
jgi:predicted GNAT family acetyltransferase